MRVLVVAAMRSELRAFTKRRPPAPDVATAVLGIGRARARASTERLLDAVRPDRVLVVGIAGGIGPTVAVGDLVVPEAVLDGATGARHRPDPLPGHEPAGTLRTGDDLVVERERVAALAAGGVVALDMETAAVAVACEARGVRWSVARGISDHADHLPVDPAVLTLLGPEGQGRPAAVARYVLGRPSRAGHLAKLARGAAAASGVAAEAGAAAVEEWLGRRD